MDNTNPSNYGQFGSMDTSSLSEKGSALMKKGRASTKYSCEIMH